MLYNEPRRRVVQQTWVFKNKLTLEKVVRTLEFPISFICDGVQYQELVWEEAVVYLKVQYIPVSGSSVTTYIRNSWQDSKYRTITLLEEPSADLLEILQNNATLQS